ncbi:MAG: hypothetical protein PHW86_01930 [Candidatus Bipolaricaulis sp.]|nr:hypothetical protein [Candidatus Bipolaricaulis sp.]
MEKTGKRVVAALVATLVGAGLVAVGVWCLFTDNLEFGIAAIVIGAVILFGLVRSATRRRAKT